jgi:hypothetical protein
MALVEFIIGAVGLWGIEACYYLWVYTPEIRQINITWLMVWGALPLELSNTN